MPSEKKRLPEIELLRCCRGGGKVSRGADRRTEAGKGDLQEADPAMVRGHGRLDFGAAPVQPPVHPTPSPWQALRGFDFYMHAGDEVDLPEIAWEHEPVGYWAGLK